MRVSRHISAFLFWMAWIALATPAAFAEDRRDIVFACPCQAEWAPKDGSGELRLTYAVRNHRASRSGEVRLAPAPAWDPMYPWADPDSSASVSAGTIAGGTVSAIRSVSIRFPRPTAVAPIMIQLFEAVARRTSSPQVDLLDDAWLWSEDLVLWPVASPGASDSARYVDLLTDSDRDGVGDANEGIAGTAADDPATKPGASTIDAVALYDDAIVDQYHGDPYTRMHHVMVVAKRLFADSDTNVRLRTVGMIHFEQTEYGEPEDLEALKRVVGADLSLQFAAPDGPWGCGGAAGCAGVGSARNRGHWLAAHAAVRSEVAADVAAHELGHVMGLAHSARQGETYGAFPWSRGHYLREPEGRYTDNGTIMSYGQVDPRWAVFSDPDADCAGVPCGASIDQPYGADAASTLDALRFQVAAHLDPLPDGDGDGFVDPVDALPDDPRDWRDADGDGLGDNADPDDDNDGVEDEEDAFPRDPDEWADADLDGVGDNADDQVADLSPFEDAQLRAVVEDALGKSPGAPISAAEMAGLVSLDGSGQGIRSLAGLDLATGLTRLDLYHNNVRDASPIAGLRSLRTLLLGRNVTLELPSLAGLTGLQELGLEHSRIGDLAPLAQLSSLEGLYLTGNQVADLTPLAQLTRLQQLFLDYNTITDIAPLASLHDLVDLFLDGNRVGDPLPLAANKGLELLSLSDNQLSDLSSIADLTQVRDLRLDNNAIVDIAPLTRLTRLHSLSLADNRIADIAPLADMAQLDYINLYLSGNAIGDPAPLSNLKLNSLEIGHNPVSLAQLAALPSFAAIPRLELRGLRIDDLSPLTNLTDPDWLDLSNNFISDLSPLAALGDIDSLFLSTNLIADIGPLLNRSIWRFSGYTRLALFDNPLSQIAIDEQIPTLQSWGVEVEFGEGGGRATGFAAPIAIPDANLQSLIAWTLASGTTLVDDPVNSESMFYLETLQGFGAGISDLSGLESATNLALVFLGSNQVTDLLPLERLAGLRAIDLSGNRVSDIAPLVRNGDLSDGAWVDLDDNPLSEEALNEQVPALLDRGVDVRLLTLRLTAATDGTSIRFDTKGYFSAVLGDDVRYDAVVGDGSFAEASIDAGVLTVVPAGRAGTVRITVTATDANAETARLIFALRIPGSVAVPFMPSASDPLRQGFVRIVNHSDAAGSADIDAIDRTGTHRGPLTLSLNAGAATHFNSDDLEGGNAGKGLGSRTGAGFGDWRLRLDSRLDFAALSYIRTRNDPLAGVQGGFLTAMHDLVPVVDGRHEVATFNPGRNTDQVSLLHLVNHGGGVARVSINGVDSAGLSPGGTVTLSMDAGAARTLSARELESGEGLDGALGVGAGKWRLTVRANQPLAVAGLLQSPTGHLTNLSTMPDNKRPRANGATAHSVPLFLAAGDKMGRQGFIRIVNHDATAAAVRVQARDETDLDFDEITLSVPAGGAVHFNSDDLELGNSGKGLSGAVGDGDGDWRLTLTSTANLDVLTYIRSKWDGFLTSMHDTVPRTSAGYWVATFNPGSNEAQVSLLRIVNSGATDAVVTIAGIDDSGASPGGEVALLVPANRSRTLSAQELEKGSPDFDGRLGDGAGKWRLTIRSDQQIQVMNLMQGPTGHLTNLSTVPGS